MAAAPQIDVRGASVELNLAPALIPFSASQQHTPSSNAAATITLTADAARPNVLKQIFCSYSATPAAGSYIQVEDGSGSTVWKQYIAAGGPNQFTFDPPLTGSVNTAMIVTLAAGGSGISGALYVHGYKHL